MLSSSDSLGNSLDHRTMGTIHRRLIYIFCKPKIPDVRQRNTIRRAKNNVLWLKRKGNWKTSIIFRNLVFY